MAESLKQTNVRRNLGNKLFLLIVVGIIMILPGYIGLGAAFVLNYGPDYINALYDPAYLAYQYWSLFTYWLAYHQQLPPEFTLKLIGPPAAGLFSSLILFYLARAP